MTSARVDHLLNVTRVARARDAAWLAALALLIAGCRSLHTVPDNGSSERDRWRTPHNWIWIGQVNPYGNSPRLTETAEMDWSTAIFRLRRMHCYGTCPVYSVSIYPDGRVEYEGDQFVGACGRHVGSITRAAHARLASAFQAARYLSADYGDPADLGRDIIQIVDIDHAHLRVEVDSRYRTVERRAPQPSTPDLASLEALIDEVGQTSRWTTCHREDCSCPTRSEPRRKTERNRLMQGYTDER